MNVPLLDTENADLNLTSLVTVLTHTPSASKATMCSAVIKLGDGTKNLSATGGEFQVVITIGSQTLQPSPQYVPFGTEPRSIIFTQPFMVPANMAVVIKVKSPNAADSDVDVTAELYDALGVDVVSVNGDASLAISSATPQVTLTGTPTTTALQFSSTGWDTTKSWVNHWVLVDTGLRKGILVRVTASSESGGFFNLTVTTTGSAAAAGDKIVLIPPSVVSFLVDNVITDLAINAAALTSAKFGPWADPSAPPAPGSSIFLGWNWVVAKHVNELRETSSAQVLRSNGGGVTIGTAPVSDDGVTTTRGKFA